MNHDVILSGSNEVSAGAACHLLRGSDFPWIYGLLLMLQQSLCFGQNIVSMATQWPTQGKGNCWSYFSSFFIKVLFKQPGPE
ncbi:hypothetical protein AV530_019557 [Patagioenas fasciata monilis]|uniref:Uncharacterized protein n=1 Tax=Patagioenas fasciata monilis TaxID=372326 RepID=A0A1V4JF48_PATFA|nr:hypothetical protein AV530_019557 [Patagioenas fasciata monilis]